MEDINFLAEAPSEQDDFTGGHNQVAESLASVIVKGNLQNNMIALEGGLGSGKSTVLRLLQDKLDSDEYAVFTFDCFKHQNGPIRRAFFELFHSFILQDNESKKSELEDLLYKSTGRYQEQEDRTQNKVSFGTLLWASFLPLAGAALLLLGNNTHKGYIDTWLIVLMCIPAALLCITLIGSWVNEYESFCLWIKSNVPNWARKLLSALKVDMSFKSGIMKGATITLSNKEVTSTDLQKYCHDYLGYSSKKIIIVLDNIDRLDSHKLFDVWADMDIFAKASSSGHWVVVPYCPDVIEKAFNERKNTDEDCELNAAAHEFINKWFSLKFRVPPVLLSDWKAYFTDCLTMAFPAIEPNTASSVLSLFRHCKDKSSDITPRNIKHFINDVAATYLSSMEKSIELPLIAVYNLLIPTNSFNEILTIANKRSPDDFLITQLPLLNPNWQVGMGAIHYNVPMDRAKQIVLYEPIETALESENHESLENNLQLHGSVDTLEDILQEQAPSLAAKALRCFSKIEHKKSGEWDALLSTLYRHLNVEILTSDVNPEETYKAVFRLYGTPAEKLLNDCLSMVDALSAETADNDQEFLLSQYNGLIDVVTVKTIKTRPENIVSHWLLGQEKYPNVSYDHLPKSRYTGVEAFNALLKNIGDGSDLFNDLTQTLNNDPFFILELVKLFPVCMHADEIDYTVKIESCIDQLHTGIVNLSEGYVGYLFLLAAVYNSGVESQVKLLCATMLDTQPATLGDNEEIVKLGLCALSIKAGIYPQYCQHFKELDYASYSEELKLLLHVNCDPVILCEASSEADHHLGKLIELSINERWYNSYRTAAITNQYQHLKDIDIEGTLLLGWAADFKTDLVNKLNDDDVIQGLDDSFFDDFLSRGSPIQIELKARLGEYIDSDNLEENFWLKCLSNPTYLAIKSVESAKIITAKHFVGGLISAIIEYLSSEDESYSLDLEFMGLCLNKMDSKKNSALAQKARDAILENCTLNNLGKVESILACNTSKFGDMTPINKYQAEGLIRLITKIAEFPMEYRQILSLIKNNAQRISQELKNNDWVELEHVLQPLAEIPYQDDKAVEGDLKALSKAFGIKRKSPSIIKTLLSSSGLSEPDDNSDE